MCVRIYDIKRYDRSGGEGETSGPGNLSKETKHEFPLLYEYYVNANLPDSSLKMAFTRETLRCWEEVLSDLTLSDWNNRSFNDFSYFIITGKKGKVDLDTKAEYNLDEVVSQIIFPEPSEKKVVGGGSTKRMVPVKPAEKTDNKSAVKPKTTTAGNKTPLDNKAKSGGNQKAGDKGNKDNKKR